MDFNPELALNGMIMGFCSSMPLGPINLIVLTSCIERRFHNLLEFLGGVILADATIAGLAFFLADSWKPSGSIYFVMTIGGSMFVILYGLLMTRQALHQIKAQTLPAAKSIKPRKEGWFFTLGLALCFSNPAFYAFWFAGASYFAFVSSGSANLIDASLFLSGAAIGDVIWFLVLALIVLRYTPYLKKLLGTIQLTTGGLCIVLGFWTIVNSVK